MENETRGVDAKILAECFAVFARVHSGATKYLRDDHDTFSPMMAKLRDDKVSQEPVIDAFLAVQRYLSLRALDDWLFDYTMRVLVMAKVMQATEDSLKAPFLRDPSTDNESALFFRALALPGFVWRDPTPVADVMVDILGKAMLLGIQEKPTLLPFDVVLDHKVEQPTQLGVLAASEPPKNRKLH